MPFITSHFLRRASGNRSHVVTERLKSFSFIGHFCELADDGVFAEEYSIRSAQTAVNSLPAYKGHYDPRVSLKALLSQPHRALSRSPSTIVIVITAPFQWARQNYLWRLLIKLRIDRQALHDFATHQ